MTVNPDQRVAVVTGSSSGIGFETSLMLARNGFYTYATMRKLDEGSNQIEDLANKENLPLQAIQLDVNDEKSVIERLVSDESSTTNIKN